ncbi:arylamine N-acetyltransferase [Novosphingobium sp.]|uniref:arylamine N-acetyltransferase family protein n=1 Tax=Novosphingobium sp. TaxID=1874826 RepID=UPI0026158643|nr:arylamine N-acetyltransferase [Novosphingobium sp.]
MAMELLNQQQLNAYLARIGFAGALRPDLATLHAVVSAHVQAIAFENIDVQLGRSLTTDVGAAFAKLIAARRGGWCYEHNGVLGAALMAIGFDVTRMSAGVMRQVRGDDSMGSHLCLLVQCEGEWLVDAGFGSWLAAPVPLEHGTWMQPPLPVSLGTTADGLWRLCVGKGASAMSYDFCAEAANEDQLSALCDWQCSDPASVFVQNLTVQRRDGARYLMLRGKVLSEVSAQGEERRELASAAELVDVLRDVFLLNVPEVASLWPAICARHEALFGAQAAPTT